MVDYFPVELIGWAFRNIIIQIFICDEESSARVIEFLQVISVERFDPREACYNMLAYLILSKRDCYLPEFGSYKSAINLLYEYLRQGDALIFNPAFLSYKTLYVLPEISEDATSNSTPLSAHTVPILILHGKLDITAPFTFAIQAQSLVTALGFINSTLAIFPGHGDCDFFNSGSSQILRNWLLYGHVATDKSNIDFGVPNWQVFYLTDQLQKLVNPAEGRLNKHLATYMMGLMSPDSSLQITLQKGLSPSI